MATGMRIARAFLWGLELYLRIVSPIVIVAGAIVLYTVLMWGMHVKLGFCPLTFRLLKPSEHVPIVYGFDVWFSYSDEIQTGKMVMGGCIRYPASAICPHCGTVAEFGK